MIDITGKLKILAFTSPRFEMDGPPILIYTAMFNPESFTVNQRVVYDQAPVPGHTSSEPAFRNIETQEFKFDFLIDGTGAAGKKRNVFADIEHFRLVVGYQGLIHRPHYLIINWGTFIARCVLESMGIKYELFDRAGLPLRATITATFIEFTDNHHEGLLANRSSPDLTHVKVVREGDTLPLLAHQVYGDASYYPEVARVNGLDNFRELRVGDEIYFPPLTSADV
jgi:hypothetical protein